MKKIFKKEVIIAFIVGIILASSIAVYAYSYAAKDVSYTKPGTTTAINVETALNELYANKNNLIKNIDLSKIDFSSSSAKFDGTNTYEFDDDYDMVLIASYSSLDCGNHYYLNDILINNTRWISDGTGKYIMSGIIINVKRGDLLKTDAATFPTSINLLKQK